MISSDKGRLKQILLNLIANALKFTFKGEIAIGAQLIVIKGIKYIEFCVKDTGIGIQKESQQNLFRLFGMVNDKNTINQNG